MMTRVLKQNWARRTWTRNAFQDVLGFLTVDTPSPKDTEQHKISRHAVTGLPGFRGKERPSKTDIEMLCHVFKHVPWSPDVEKHLRQRNFCITENQVIQVLHSLKDDLGQSLSFFIWAGQQRGYCHTIDAVHILKNIIEQNLSLVHFLLKDMEAKNCYIPLVVFMVLMDVFEQKNMVNEALEAFHSASKFGSRPDENAYDKILHILVNAERFDSAFLIFEQMKEDKWCSPGKTTTSLILYSLGKVGRVSEARKLIRSSKSNAEISCIDDHNRVVAGLCEGGFVGQAEELIIEMYELGLEPDVQTYTHLICGYVKVDNVTQAYRYYVEAFKDKHITPSTEVFTMLIRGFCKKNNVEKAAEVLRKMTANGIHPESSLYCLLIQLSIQQEQYEIGKELWDEMLEKRMEPDAEAYNVIFNAYVAASQTEMALSMLCKMTECKGTSPDEAAFASLVLCLIKLDQLEMWKRLFAAIDCLEEDSKASMYRIIMENMSETVAEELLNLIVEKGLSRT